MSGDHRRETFIDVYVVDTSHCHLKPSLDPSTPESGMQKQTVKEMDEGDIHPKEMDEGDIHPKEMDEGDIHPKEMDEGTFTPKRWMRGHSPQRDG